MLIPRQVVRSITHRPGSSALLIVLVAIGVALSTTIFAVVRTVLLEPLPYRDAERLVKPWGVAESFGIDRYPFSWDNYRDYRDRVEAFDGLAAVRTVPLTLDGADRPTSVTGVRATANLFEVLGVAPVLGRTFDDGEQGVALIGHGLWHRQFAGASDVVGRAIRLDGEPFTIVGVLPAHLRFPNPDSEVFFPLLIETPPETVRAFHFLRLVGRLRDGATLAEAEAEAKTLAAHLAETYPDASGELGVRLVPLKEELVGNARRSLTTLFAAVQVLFFLAWSNIAILLLARGMARRGELELRTALGATRSRLFAQLLVEAVLLSGIGSALGLFAGGVAVSYLPRLDPGLLPRAYEVQFGPDLVLWAGLLSLAGAVVFGSVPAWAATRGAGSTLNSTRTTDRRTARLNMQLVAAQVALVLPLLVASSMQLRSVQALSAVETGFPVERALAAGAALPRNQFGPPEQKHYIDRAIAAIERIPGVVSVGAMSHLPLSTRAASIVTFRPDQDGQSGLPNAHYRVISAGLLDTLGIPLVAGREFDARDDTSDHPVVVVDEKLAHALFPDRDAVGQRVRLGSDSVEWEIVGVARAARLVSLDQEPDNTVYVPILQNKFSAALSTPKFIIRTAQSPRTLAAVVRKALQDVDPEQAILEVRPLTGQLDDWLGNRRAVAALLWAIAAAALLLAAAGIYATLAFAVGRRLREIAIRAALGAGTGRLARGVVVDGLKPSLFGATVGLVVCLVVGRLLVGVLFGVQGIDVPSLVGALAILFATSIVACVAPARRALREDPGRLLREDEA